jgi:hypothetical protein
MTDITFSSGNVAAVWPNVAKCYKLTKPSMRMIHACIPGQYPCQGLSYSHEGATTRKTDICGVYGLATDDFKRQVKLRGIGSTDLPRPLQGFLPSRKAATAQKPHTSRAKRERNSKKVNSNVIPVNRPWRTTGVYPARYEHHLHINK